jgi:hypothetical protein
MIIPEQQLEIYLALGFRLTDEPTAGLARVSFCGVGVSSNQAHAGRPEKATARRSRDPNGPSTRASNEKRYRT